jgi:hypothetical protein
MDGEPDSQEFADVAKVLTEIEKLDGSYPGLGTKVRICLDQGIPVRQLQKMINKEYGVSVTKDMVAYFRTNRWGPLKDRIETEAVTVKAIIEAVGGDAGVDEFMSARLLEDVRALEHDELIDVKELFVKIRAQNLKEQEFLFNSGQLKLNKPADGTEEDAAAEEAKTKRVMNKIRGIFGLEPLPDEPDDQEPQAGNEESEDKSQANQGGIEPPATPNSTSSN